MVGSSHLYLADGHRLFFSGAFSNVYKARDRRTGQKVAIKVVRKYELNSNQVSKKFSILLSALSLSRFRQVAMLNIWVSGSEDCYPLSPSDRSFALYTSSTDMSISSPSLSSQPFCTVVYSLTFPSPHHTYMIEAGGWKTGSAVQKEESGDRG